MGFAHLAHHRHQGVQIPVEPYPRLLRRRPSPFLSSGWLPSADRRASTSTSTSTSLRFSVGNGRSWPLRLVRVCCAPETEHDGSQITEEKEKIKLVDETESSDLSSLHPTSVDYTEAKLEHDTMTLAKYVVFWILAAVVFGVGLGIKDGTGKASEFFAGYLLEKSLSVDNLFVFILIFKYFQVPTSYQGRVLSYGIAGAVIFRAIMIILGVATLQRFEAVNLLLAAVLIYSSYKLFVAEDEETDLSNNFIVKTCQNFIPITSYYDGDRFFTIVDGARKATPLLLTVAVLELSDVAFAIDSIPAVFGVTRDPFIVFSSNIFAILGLRSLYRLIAESMTGLEYLQPSIGVVLGFIGSKMILDFFGYHISTEASLGFVATSLGTGLVLSLVKKSD